MSRMYWNRRGFAGLLVAALFLAGCTTAQLGGGGTPPPTAAPVKGSAAVFAFAPVDGVPVQILQALSAALNREAAAQGLHVVPNSDPSRVYEVRGFVSAVPDGQSTRLVYVWDVVDNSGQRLQRFTGQQEGGHPTGGPWTGIGNTTVDLAAKDTIADLVRWAGA